MKKIAQRFVERSGNDALLESLKKLSGSELNSVLLEVFRSRVESVRPADLLGSYAKNRFTIPSAVETIAYREFEVACLKLAKARKFAPVTLSPLAPLGTSSAFGAVDQNNVVSAVRGTEVVSDATNVLALLVAAQYKKEPRRPVVKYAVTHRHVRGQAFTNPGFSAHFGIFCLVTGGLDKGSFSFETENLVDHLAVHLALLRRQFKTPDLSIKLFIRDPNEQSVSRILAAVKPVAKTCPIELVPASGGYYSSVQFKVFLRVKKDVINITDGGIVDWTQQLVSNRKHRLMISGSGLELMYKIKNSLV